MTNNFEDLIHSGKKGMKWGVRKSGISGEHATLKGLKRNKAKTLTDAELRSAISRMSLEKQYKDLNPNKLTKAHKVVLTALAVGTTINSVMLFAKSPAGKAIQSAIDKLPV